ncbi:hypothetical protein C8R47DRAFT_487656 [Mycena vitilis]|nr:hypothetical protein C8R47DRAFT_487656 [Mycena vitilis]
MQTPLGLFKGVVTWSVSLAPTLTNAPPLPQLYPLSTHNVHHHPDPRLPGQLRKHQLRLRRYLRLQARRVQVLNPSLWIVHHEHTVPMLSSPRL